MEGDKFSGKAQLAARMSGTPQPSPFIFFSVIGCVFHGLSFPPLWYFPLSHAAPLLTACFRWVLDLELGALRGLCSSLAALAVFIGSLGFSVSSLWPLIPPLSLTLPFCLSVAALCPLFLSCRWFHPLKRSPSTQTALISQNFLSLLSAFFCSPLV